MTKKIAIDSTKQPSSLKFLHHFHRHHRDPSNQHPDTVLYTDYVIHFAYPPSPASPSEEEHAIKALRKLTTRLRAAGLYYEVRQSKNEGKLYVFVLCPWKRLKQEITDSRMRDWLAGVKYPNDKELTRTISATELTEADRLRHIYSIITSPSSEHGAGVIISRETCIESIMALHNRQFNRAWVHDWSQKYYLSDQDIQRIRSHFGEKIALYFTFQQYYTLWLTVPSMVGILAYIYTEFSIAYAVFIVAWAIAFIEFWKWRERELAMAWGVYKHSLTEKRRAAFCETHPRRDIHGSSVPCYPIWKRWATRCFTWPAVVLGAFGFGLVLTFVFAMQVFFSAYYQGPLSEVLNYIPAMIQSSAVANSNNNYLWWMRKLNDLENFELESQYEYHLTIKIFVAKALTSYVSLLLCAWVYIPFGERIGRSLNSFLTTQHRGVGPERLRSMLVYFVLTGQVIHFSNQKLVPFLQQLVSDGLRKALDQVRRRKHEHDDMMHPLSENEENVTEFMRRVEREAALPVYEVEEDYTEMVTQFGYVVLFSVVWPLTPLCAFVNNWMEMRNDAMKLCLQRRRAPPQRADTIGPWRDSLSALAFFSAVTNSSFTYLFHPKAARVWTSPRPSVPDAGLFFVVLVAEYLYFALKSVIHRLWRALPSPGRANARRMEFELKAKWLEKSEERHEMERKLESKGASEVKREQPKGVWMDDDGQEELGLTVVYSTFKSQ
ncbi:uncharacterized protein VTP21DRAFT_907 [Calcarisporiella thermophila]|uniref:uncharacterized protein n=1 Tax=Calcarisporiella thermophila TaxID=911321 RepID=UPI00374386D7